MLVLKYSISRRLWGSSILGVFSTFQKAEPFKKKFREIYPNKYSSSDFWNIKITETRLKRNIKKKQDGYGMSLIFNNLETKSNNKTKRQRPIVSSPFYRLIILVDSSTASS